MKVVVSVAIGILAAWASAEIWQKLWVSIFSFIVFTYGVAMILYSEPKR